MVFQHFLISSHAVAGLWKSPAESTRTFSVSGLQRGTELHTSSCPTSQFLSASKPGLIEFNASNKSSAANIPMYRPIISEHQTDSFGADKEHSERKQETSTGCWLFGIQLVESSAVEEISPLTTISCVRDEQPVTSLDVESDQQSQPSNVKRSDTPAGSNEPEKSCLRSAQEYQSRLSRSCIKVIISYFFLPVCFSSDQHSFSDLNICSNTLVH